MVFPDRTAKPAMHEFKAIAAPAVSREIASEIYWIGVRSAWAVMRSPTTWMRAWGIVSVC
jgi:hypothetical protein